jgi:hypothetical protein
MTKRRRVHAGATIQESLDFHSRKVGECIEWFGSISHKGYGQIGYQGKRYRAHRLAYINAHGDIPEGLIVMHKCDNRACVNPDHLTVGTYQQNTNDMIKKNRQPVGEQLPHAKLGEANVLDIKERLSRGESQPSIAAIHGVSRTTISAISTGRNWKHINARSE